MYKVSIVDVVNFYIILFYFCKFLKCKELGGTPKKGMRKEMVGTEGVTFCIRKNNFPC